MEPKQTVLGSEMAAALAAERVRQASADAGPSPISGKGYDAERGEFNLTVVSELPLDREIEQLVRAWRLSAADEREAARRRLSLEDNYTLIQFAKRTAVRSLNQTEPTLCELGLSALAMIDDTRIDPRDASWAAGLLNHAASAWPDRSGGLFEGVAATATRGMGECLRRAYGNPPLEEWGYRELRTGQGVGLIRSGWAPYEPSIDLAALAARIGARLLADRYVVDVEVATKIPPVWFAARRRQQAEKRLERALGIVAIHGTLRRAIGDSGSQMFVTWVAEMPAPDDCVELVADVGSGTGLEGRSVVGVSASRLFALVVAGSTRMGVPPYESRSALADLAARLKPILSESAGP